MPDVSVMMVTHNHGMYIESAIESVLMQKDVSFELIISDDASTDRTTELVERYRQTYPSAIKFIRTENRTGPQSNYLRAMDACSARYIAILDGDDFWINKDKLAEQTALLDKRIDCNICFGQALEVTECTINNISVSPRFRRDILTIHDLITWDFIPTSTAMFRRCASSALPAWIAEMTSFDWVLWIVLSAESNIFFQDKILSVYRKHQRGIWTSKTPLEQIAADESFYKRMRCYLPPRFGGELDRALERLAARRSEIFASMGKPASGEGSRENTGC